MRKIAVLTALVMIGINFTSCSPESISEQDTRYTTAAEGDDGHDHEEKGND